MKSKKEISVLDKGFVRLVDSMGDDAAIVQSARVSYGKGTKKLSEDRVLIRYLIRNKHTTPLEMVTFKFHVKAPLFVLRQWHRHRTWCLSGDTQIVYDGPTKAKKGEFKKCVTTISELWDKWHNGAKPIITKDGASVRMPMKKRIQNMYVRCMNEETGRIQHTHIKDIWKSGEKEVFELELDNGYKLKCSKDHEIYTEDGWKTLKDFVKISSREVSYWEDIKIGTNGRFELGSIPWNKGKKYKLNLSEEQRENIRKRAKCNAKRGSESNFWKGGISSDREKIARWTSEQLSRVIRKYERCVITGRTDNLQAHHIDPIFNNESLAYDFDNLICLCKEAHKKIHSLNLELVFKEWVAEGKELSLFFEKNNIKIDPPKAKKISGGQYLYCQFVSIKSVRYVGLEETYDISVRGPYHNFIANGIVVHNSYNEMSGRYSEMPEDCYVPKEEYVTTQDPNNKQGGTDMKVPWEKDKVIRGGEIIKSWSENMKLDQDRTREYYNTYIDSGMRRELARINLPLAQYSEMYAKVDLHNLFHFLRLRMDSHAQFEIREYANALYELIKPVVPIAAEAFEEYYLGSLTLNKKDQEFLAACFLRESGSTPLQTPEDFEKLASKFFENKREKSESIAKITKVLNSSDSKES